MKKIIGYKKFTSKKGSPLCLVTVVSDLTDRQREFGAVGQTCEDVFLPEKQTDLLVPDDIGKEIKLDYEMSSGRAYLVNVKVVK